jgi:hypothetical protein
MVGLSSTYLGVDVDALSGVYRRARMRREADRLATVAHRDTLETRLRDRY